jgi:hypothetical protein
MCASTRCAHHPGTRPIRRRLIDTRSVTRPPLPSTRAVVAGAHLCDQVASLLPIEPKVARQGFLREPIEEVMAMVKWALKHEGEADFNPEKILPGLGTEARMRLLEDGGQPGRGVRAMPRDRVGTRSFPESRGVG